MSEEKGPKFVARVIKSRYEGSEGVHIFAGQIYDPRADWAREMANHWGMVAGIQDGEDSQGRAKARLTTPEEVVDRACACAHLLWEQFNDRGWVIDIPIPRHPDEVKAEMEAEKQKVK